MFIFNTILLPLLPDITARITTTTTTTTTTTNQ